MCFIQRFHIVQVIIWRDKIRQDLLNPMDENSRRLKLWDSKWKQAPEKSVVETLNRSRVFLYPCHIYIYISCWFLVDDFSTHNLLTLRHADLLLAFLEEFLGTFWGPWGHNTRATCANNLVNYWFNRVNYRVNQGSLGLRWLRWLRKVDVGCNCS